MSQLQTLLFRIGGVLMIIGAALPLFVPAIAPYVYTLGALLFCPIQMLDRYEGSNPVTRRLRRQQLFGSFALLVAGCFSVFTTSRLSVGASGRLPSSSAQSLKLCRRSE